MNAASFSVERLARLQVPSVDAALTWLASTDGQTPALGADGATVGRRALFSCMVERSLPIPLVLLGVRSLLLIDDEPAVLRATSRVLRQAAPDLNLVLAEGPNEGLAQLAAFTPDAILLDAYMPHMSGVELCDQIRGALARAQLPVVAMTADPTPDLAAAFGRAGAIAFLEKPVDAPSLFDILSGHLLPNSLGDES